MKNKLFVLIICIVSVCATYAQDQYNTNQVRFRNDINQFLREEGYSPSINSGTGDINFKMEGTNYVVDLDTDYKGPYLVTLSATFNMESLSYSDKQKLYEVENTINSKYDCVKVSYFEHDGTGLLIFSIESFCHNSDDFKYALVKYLGFIKSAIGDFRNQYSDETSSSRNSTHIEVHNSNTLRTSDHSWDVISVDLTPGGTILNKSVKPRSNSTSIWSSKDEYIEDADTGKKYYILDSSIGFTKYKTILNSTETRTFTETYPVLPLHVKRINISSGSYYYVKNLLIR